MDDFQIEYIEKHCVGSRGAFLLWGDSAKEELITLFKTLELPGKRYFLDIAENETQFWNNLLSEIGGKSWQNKNFERQTACDYVEAHLRKNKTPNHLFLPDVDEMFFKYDIRQGGLMNAGLRRLWSDSNINLTIFGSARDRTAENYKKTFCEYTFPFYIGNWSTIRIE